MAKNYVEFFNGCKMPIVGLGTWQAINQEKFEDGLESALEMGYRLIDTAYMSTNEDAIGKVLKKWLDSGRVTRKELFIVTKLPPIGMRPEHVPHFLDLSLTDLQLDYVDLYLVHFPIGFNYVNDSDLYPIRKDGKISIDKTTNLEAIWKAMESQVKKGLAKSIGVSNFSITQMERILKVAKIQPANHQVELHAYYQQNEMQQFCKKHKITLCAYASLGSPGRKERMFARVHNFVPMSLMEDPVVVEMARQHNRTPAQILLRFLTQKNIVVIPKSTNEDHLKMNFEILDFRLTTYDITRLEALDKEDAGKTFHSNIFAGSQEYVPVKSKIVGKAGGHYVEENELKSIIGQTWLVTSVIDTFAFVLGSTIEEKIQGYYYIPTDGFRYNGKVWKTSEMYKGQLLETLLEGNDVSTITTIINVGNHWLLVVAKVQTKEIGIIDTLPGSSSVEVVHGAIQNLIHSILDVIAPDVNWKIGLVPSISEQRDGHSCGSACLFYLEKVIRGANLGGFRPHLYDDYRQKILKRTLNTTKEGRKLLKSRNVFSKYLKNCENRRKNSK